MSEKDKSPYDAVADYYACAWDDWYVHSIRPALETLLFPLLAPNARVLDVCCGCGHVTGELVKAGFRTTGFDLSRELCARAARSLPDASFFTADVRTFVTRRVFEGAISTFDSLNHMLTIRDLGEALRSIHGALKPGSPFLFDMNLEEAYSLDLDHWTSYQRRNALGFVRGHYDPSEKRARTELIWFTRSTDPSLWKRADSVVEEQCYSEQEIESALRRAGFRQITFHSAAQAGVKDELGFGRIYVLAR